MKKTSFEQVQAIIKSEAQYYMSLASTYYEAIEHLVLDELKNYEDAEWFFDQVID